MKEESIAIFMTLYQQLLEVIEQAHMDYKDHEDLRTILLSAASGVHAEILAVMVAGATPKRARATIQAHYAACATYLSDRIAAIQARREGEESP